MEIEWLFDRGSIKTPSTEQGYSPSLEHKLRDSTCNFICDLVLKLRMPQITSTTAMIYFNRFFMTHAMQDHDRFLVAASCVYLASKATECPVKLMAFTEQTVILIDSCQEKSQMPHAAEIEHVKCKIRQYEVILLNTLSYNLVVANPFALVQLKIDGIQCIINMPVDEIRGLAWAFASDALKSTIGVQFTMDEIAAGSVYLSYVFHRIPKSTLTDDGKPWWSVLGPTQEDLDHVCNAIMATYASTRKRSSSAFQWLFDNYPTSMNIN
ncbi:hypothetical protein THRCLA_02061 [Thraustotheca clavata]|uniref:Cyclin-like domain-containing protein n=1 Tax=Thraustotheca clavata TaxID=74557 RepID=A0A1W0A6F9_9STRA|nr:hypothetical protein THRCLA_02061 [Thraustotheca clavata]